MKLYQIRLTNNEIRRANLGEKFPALDASRDAMCFGDFHGREFYTHVADIDTTDLNHAFEIGNVGPEAKITRHAPMHSVSVGDVLVAEHEQAFIVKPVGFAAVMNW